MIVKILMQNVFIGLGLVITAGGEVFKVLGLTVSLGGIVEEPIVFELTRFLLF